MNKLTKIFSLAAVLLLAGAFGGQPLLAQASTIYITNTAATTWVVPADWNDSSNNIQVIGGGGGGGGNTTDTLGGSGAGGGGAYSRSNNVNLTGGSTININVGVGGTSNQQAGEDTWFNGASCAGASVCAKGGGGGINGGAGGAGGAAASGVGATKYSGGAGGSSTGAGGTGGGGAGGPNGNGAAGGATSHDEGGGGGGSSGGSGGTIGHYDPDGCFLGCGGRGGDGPTGSGGGAKGNGGTQAGNATAGLGGGGGGADDDVNSSGGGDGSMYASIGTVGPGGGGGGGGQSGVADGGNGSVYGGGGGGGASKATPDVNVGGNGGQGVIVVTYSNIPVTTLTYSLNGAAYVAAPASLTIDANDSLAFGWGGTNAPTSCVKTAGSAGFAVSGASGADAIPVTEPTAGGAAVAYGVRCDNASGTGTTDSTTVTRLGTPVTTITYSLNGGAYTAAGASLTIDANDALSLAWSGTFSPTSCTKVAGSAGFAVSNTTGPDAIPVTEPTSGGAAVAYSVRCDNAGGTGTTDSVTITRTPTPVTSMTYALNGGAYAAVPASIVLDANDTIAFNWSASGAPSSCTKTSGAADFVVAAVTGPDTTIAGPVAGAAAIVYGVRCDNSGGQGTTKSVSVTRNGTPVTTMTYSLNGGAFVAVGATLSIDANDALSLGWGGTYTPTGCTKTAGSASFAVSNTTGPSAIPVTEPTAGGAAVAYGVRCDNAGGQGTTDSVTVTRTTVPVTSMTYSLNGGAYAAVPASLVLNANDTLAFNWSGTNSPSSCTKTSGAADFIVGGTTGPDTTIAGPAAGAAAIDYGVRCDNSSGQGNTKTVSVTRNGVPATTLTVSINGGAYSNPAATVNVNQSDTVSFKWSGTYSPTGCTKSGAADFTGATNTTGPASVTPPTQGNTVTYGVSCTNAGGTGAVDTIAIHTNAACVVNTISYPSRPAPYAFYRLQTIPYGEVCATGSDTNGAYEQDRTCTNGTMSPASASYIYNSCAPEATPLTVSITANGVSNLTTVRSGRFAQVAWSSTGNITSCQVSGSGTFMTTSTPVLPSTAQSGSTWVQINGKTIFTISCQSAASSQIKTQTVNVFPQLQEI
jgi:hypothetical protein